MRRPAWRQVVTRVGVGAGVVTLSIATASTAMAADSGRIPGYTVEPDGHLKVAFSAVGLAPGESIDAASVQARLDGQVVPSKVVDVAASQQPQRITVLTIDVSGSMSKPLGSGGTTRIDAARNAAKTYLAAVPKDVLVGLVTFESTARVLVPPTTDRRKVTAAVDSLAASNGSTALFSGVIAANGALGKDGQRNQLIIADGGNDTGATEPQALASIKTASANSPVTIDAVSIGADDAGKKQLATITTAGNRGKTVEAQDTATLDSYFEAAAQTQANEIYVDITVPPSAAGRTLPLTITATAGTSTIGDTIAAYIPAVATSASPVPPSSGPLPAPVPEPGITSSSWFLPVAVGAVALGLFSLLAVAVSSVDRDSRERGRVARRLQRYSLTPRSESAAAPAATSGALGQSQVARSASEFAGRVVQGRDLDASLALKLDAAGVPLKPGEWMLVHVGTAILAALLFALLSGLGIVPTLLGLALGVIGPYLYLSIKESKRKSRFAEQLPGTLQLLSGTIAAGYSLPQAVDSVVRESDGPMAVELNRALVEARLGVPIEEALETVATRMDSVDFAWVVMAIKIQREVGGNLSEVLSNVAATMRERERLRRQVEVLSAEGRLSAIILGALPVLFVVYLVLVRPEYIGLLVTTPLGLIMIAVGLVLMIIGAFWLRKVVKVEV